MKRIARIFVFALMLLMLLPTVLSATVPYSTYTYSIDGDVLDSPDAYVPQQQIDSISLGLSRPITSPSDVDTDKDGNVYIVDKGKTEKKGDILVTTSRIIVTDPFYKVKFEINSFINASGVDDYFDSPESLFVVNNVENPDYNGIYVCDSKNARLVVFDLEGNFIREIKKPKSNLIDEGAEYFPVSCVVDKYGRIYVASTTNREGVIVMTFAGDFINFIGAPKVTVSALEALIQMISPSAAENLAFIPTAYSTLELDEETGEFVYASINYAEGDDEDAQLTQITTKLTDGSPVRLLNANGDDIMKRNGFFAPAGEVAVDSTIPLTGSNANAPKGVSDIVDVASGPNGVWSIIDQKRSKVYTYDRDGNLLYIFGDAGSQLGNLTKAKAIAYQYVDVEKAVKDETGKLVYQKDDKGEYILDANGNKQVETEIIKETYILVVDSDEMRASITVYRRTEYAGLLDEAIGLQNERDYEGAALKWDEVLASNNNFDTAYVEKGKALYREGKYDEALKYFENAYDIENYATTFQEIRKEKSSKPIVFIGVIVAIVLVLIGIGWVFKKAGKINKATAVKAGPRKFTEELTFGFHLMFHPFDGYWDLKHEKRGSVRAATVFLICTIVAFIYQGQGQGYYYNPQRTGGSAFGQIFSVIIPFALWVIANWCFTTLFDGEGSIKDIYIAVGYALFPVPILVIISTALTNILVGTESQITTMIVTIAYIWMALLIIIGMQVTHDYSSGKNILTIIATLVGMIFIMFLAVLFVSLISKMISLVSTISSELSYR